MGSLQEFVRRRAQVHPAHADEPSAWTPVIVVAGRLAAVPGPTKREAADRACGLSETDCRVLLQPLFHRIQQQGMPAPVVRDGRELGEGRIEQRSGGRRWRHLITVDRMQIAPDPERAFRVGAGR